MTLLSSLLNVTVYSTFLLFFVSSQFHCLECQRGCRIVLCTALVYYLVFYFFILCLHCTRKKLKVTFLKIQNYQDFWTIGCWIIKHVILVTSIHNNCLTYHE